MVSFHVLLLDTVGNNFVNADFSPYSRMFFAVKHIYLTLYIVDALRISPIYSMPPALPPCGRARVRACTCVRACGRRPSGPIASGRSSCLRPCDRARSRACLLPCCSLRLPACSRVCGRVGLRPRVWVPAWVCGRVRACAWALSAYLPVACRAFYSPIMAHFIRLYCSFSRRASARWACRKLF